jgi:hypothetical protein
MLGFCTDRPPLLLVLELASRGDLRTFLVASRATNETAQTVSSTNQLSFAIQVSFKHSVITSRL